MLCVLYIYTTYVDSSIPVRNEVLHSWIKDGEKTAYLSELTQQEDEKDKCVLCLSGNNHHPDANFEVENLKRENFIFPSSHLPTFFWFRLPSSEKSIGMHGYKKPKKWEEEKVSPSILISLFKTYQEKRKYGWHAFTKYSIEAWRRRRRRQQLFFPFCWQHVVDHPASCV